MRTRQDVVIVDPERFLAAARAAFREKYPDAPEEAVAEQVRDVYDAVYALVERDGRLVADVPAPAGGRLPGERVLDRPDGLSPAGEIQQIVLDVRPVQDYGCFLPLDEEDLFATRPL